MMSHTGLTRCLLLMLIAPAIVHCVSVIGPKVLRPFTSYKVAVAGGSRTYSIYVAIEGRRANGEQFSQGRELQVPAAESRLVEIEVGDPGPGKYALIARSTSGPVFSSSANIVYQPRSFCVLLQTDKRVYQPRDTIKFRVVALNKYLLPLSGTADVSILDAGGTPIRQWVALSLDRGVAAEELQLADDPALGEWTLQVEVRGQTYSRRVLVADYVLPKFQMSMEMPKEVMFSEGRFTINVTASHFNGLPVRGELTISATAVFFAFLAQPVYSTPARKVIDFNGQAQVTYDLTKDLGLAEDAARPLVIEAVLEEKDTLIRQNVSTRILLLRTPYRLKLSAPRYFKPTLPFDVQIEVVDTAGQVLDVNEEVTIERLWNDGTQTNITTKTLKNGYTTYSITPEAYHVNSTLNLVIKYKEVAERVINVQSSESSSGHYLTILLVTHDTSVGDVMKARVLASETMDLIHYAVIGRGDILVARTIELNPARRSVDLTVPVTAAMAPGCVLLVWYPRLHPVHNNILSAAVYVPHSNLLQHKVSLTLPTPKGGVYRPNALVEFRVSGEPGSTAQLLGVDSKAVATGLSDGDGLGSGMDLHTIEREVESFNALRHSLLNKDFSGLGMDLSGLTALETFNHAGVVILADGLDADASDTDSSTETVETATRPPLAGPYAFTRLPPPPSPRYYLSMTPQSTWMVTNLTLGSDAKFSGDQKGISARNEPGDFTVGAFAVHPTLGLGLATPKTLTTALPLYITAELPNTLQRGETLAAIIILKSSLTVDLNVEVTFHNSHQYFEFEPLENNIDSSKKIELFRRVRMTIPARGTASTAFLVSAARVGEVSVIVEAAGNGVSASLFRTIDVQDGYEEEIYTWGLLDARRGVSRSNVTLEPAAGTRLSSTALLGAGSVLAQAAQNLVKPPIAPADPNYALRPMAVAAVLLDFLLKEDPEESAITMAARKQILNGYQRLMAYRLENGSFTAQMGPDAEGDVLMTAIATRWVSRSARLLAVSPAAVTLAARWLAGRQRPDGGWDPPPTLTRNHPHAQTPIALAAHVLIAFQQIKNGEVLYGNTMNKALDFVARSVSPELDPYTLAIASCALANGNHPIAQQALQIMDKYANFTESTLHWPRKVSNLERRNPWLRGNSIDVATAGWALRAMMATGLTEQAPNVAKYLIKYYQPNDNDPDLLDVLSQYTESIKTPNRLRVLVNVTGFEEPRQFSIDDDNAFILQTQLIRTARSVFATTEGRGVAVVGVMGHGSTNVTAAWPRYILDPRVDQVSTKDRLQLSICIGFVPQGNETESGLTLLTVQLPSGYLADINTLTELTSARHVVGARLVEGGAGVVCWVRARPAERCATLAAPRALPTAAQRPGWATLIDLYDSSHRARVFFQPIQSTPCDACRLWPSCSNVCGAAGRQTAAEDAPGANINTNGNAKANSHAASFSTISYALLALTTVIMVLR